MHEAFVALGSNMGERRHFIREAIRKISHAGGIKLLKCSSVYDTYPIGGRPEDRFLNCVAKIDTSLSPVGLLRRLQRIEKILGRRRDGRNKPRTIDLDILLYDDMVLRNKTVAIPHPRMHKRDFILFGMDEIAPTSVHPVLKTSIEGLLQRRRMRVVRSPKKAYELIALLKRSGKRIGFVPTMGSLHEGHLSLIRMTRHENDFVVVSIFVNPAQFGPNEDYRRYPRDFKADCRLAKKAGADMIFHPDVSAMYPEGYMTYVEVERLSNRLCGRFRPGHFRGVATVVAKLFNIIPADNAYFGQKDAQQAAIIKKMSADLNIPVKIKVIPTRREKNGLAMSSRNMYLAKGEREEAPILYKTLLLAKKLVKGGERSPSRLTRSMKDFIRKNSSAQLQYISIVDAQTLDDARTVRGNILVAVAAWFGRTRLIDNIIIKA